ncbi:B3 domain-containing protein Os03g0212300-like isoform X1 [Triticum urartu]|uniref:B3 domain-containing protein Os03g0212300-like isoform X1 n=1 Tax=Triticum urartu TaxID=4572 RepID=UPI0020441DD5|nr:B3 domain-containing protein Os03g0212300-like isoform X1 [Triticum urartu]
MIDSHLIREGRGKEEEEEEEEEAEGFATTTMEEEKAFPSDSSGFEFFIIMLSNSLKKLRMPDKFAKVLAGREPREVKLREAGSGRRSLWDVKVVLDADGHTYLGRGWERFARAHDLRLGYFLVFSYDGDAVLTVKVFDVSMCRRHYKHHDDDDASARLFLLSFSSFEYGGCNRDGFRIWPGSGSSSDSGGSSSAEVEVDDAPTSQFTVRLSGCHFLEKQQQYLNVPLEFHEAHGYAERSKVVLRMSGKSWGVTLKHTNRAGGKTRSSFRYGWHQFLVDNRLTVGDTCFFRALRAGGEDHELKVQVRMLDGTFVE